MTILKERGICNMANLDLTKYGITGTTEIVHNPSYELLFEEETKPELVGYEQQLVGRIVHDLRSGQRAGCCQRYDWCLHWPFPQG